MNTQTQIITHASAPVGLLNLESFELSQRIAKMLSSSTLVPEDYRATRKVKAGKDNFGNWIYKEEANPNGLANCVIALNMAHRMGADPLMVMQNLYLIEGRPAWSSQFIMASINSSGRFSALRFEIEDLGEKEVEYSMTEWQSGRKSTSVKKIKIHDLSCVAHAIERETNERIESSKITIEMAVKEGWFTKNGSKWQTMPEQMLRYRAASFFGRVYAPELLMGLRSTEEEQDRLIDVTPTVEQGTVVDQFDFKQLKRDILTAKSPEQLQKLEIFIEEYSNEDEQKELTKLMQAQITKLTVAPTDTITKASKAEPKQTAASKKQQSKNKEEKPLIEQIQEAQNNDELDELLKEARRFTGEKGHALMAAWSARKAILSQSDIFAEQPQPSELIKNVIERIDKCQTQDEINKIFEEDQLSNLNESDSKLVNEAADRREAEITS